MLGQRRRRRVDAGPTSNQHCFIVLCLMGPVLALPETEVSTDGSALESFAWTIFPP